MRAIVQPRERFIGLRLTVTIVLLGALPGVWWPGTEDVGRFWVPWMANTRTQGFVAGYRSNAADYPPLASLLLGPCSWLHVDPVIGIKVSLFLCVVVAIWAFARATDDALTTALVGVTLAVNSVWLGCLDGLLAPFLIVGLVAWKRERWDLATVALVLASLVKWQAILLLPFLALSLWRARAMRATVLGGALGVAVASVYGIQPVVESLVRGAAHPTPSANALNLGWLVGWLLTRSTPIPIVLLPTSLLLVPLRLLGVCVFGVLWWRARQADQMRMMVAAAVSTVAFLMLGPGTHENHWFVPAIVLAFAASDDQTWRWPAIGVAVLANMNLLLFYQPDGTFRDPTTRMIAGLDISIPLALAAVVMSFWMARRLSLSLSRVEV